MPLAPNASDLLRRLRPWLGKVAHVRWIIRRSFYQDEADASGFSMTIGDCQGNAALPCVDAVTIRDTIDLQIVNPADILAGVIRLTPFVSSDNRSFVAPPDRDTRFTSADGITVIVPAGAFDAPTTISVGKADPSALAMTHGKNQRTPEEMIYFMNVLLRHAGPDPASRTS